MGRPAKPLEYEITNFPLPERAPPAASFRSAIFKLLASMKVNGPSLDVNRNPSSMLVYAYQFRQTYGVEMRFIVRRISAGHSRVWRVA